MFNQSPVKIQSSQSLSSCTHPSETEVNSTVSSVNPKTDDNTLSPKLYQGKIWFKGFAPCIHPSETGVNSGVSLVNGTMRGHLQFFCCWHEFKH